MSPPVSTASRLPLGWCRGVSEERALVFCTPGAWGQAVILDAHEPVETVLTHTGQLPAALGPPLGRLLLGLGLSMFLQGRLHFCIWGRHTCQGGGGLLATFTSVVSTHMLPMSKCDVRTAL